MLRLFLFPGVWVCLAPFRHPLTRFDAGGLNLAGGLAAIEWCMRWETFFCHLLFAPDTGKRDRPRIHHAVSALPALVAGLTDRLSLVRCLLSRGNSCSLLLKLPDVAPWFCFRHDPPASSVHLLHQPGAELINHCLCKRFLLQTQVAFCYWLAFVGKQPGVFDNNAVWPMTRLYRV